MLYRDVHVTSVHCGCRKGAFYGASMSVRLEFATTKEMNNTYVAYGPRRQCEGAAFGG